MWQYVLIIFKKYTCFKENYFSLKLFSIFSFKIDTVKSGKFAILLDLTIFYSKFYLVNPWRKKLSICLNSGPRHKLGLIRPSLCLGPQKKFQVRVTNLPNHRVSSSYGRKGKCLRTNIYTGGQVRHPKEFLKKSTDLDEAIDTSSRSIRQFLAEI